MLSRSPSAVETSEDSSCKRHLSVPEAQIKMLGTDIGHGMTLLLTSCSEDRSSISVCVPGKETLIIDRRVPKHRFRDIEGLILSLKHNNCIWEGSSRDKN